MAKVYTYVVFVLGILVLLNIAGVSLSSNLLLDALNVDNPSGFSGSGMFATMLTALALGTVTAIVIGIFTSHAPESFIIAGFTTALATWLATDMVGLYILLNNSCSTGSGCEWIPKIALAVMIPLFGGFIISIIQWWRGND